MAETATQPLSEPTLGRAFRGHSGAITGVRFHPEEQQVVSSSEDGCVFVWHFKQHMRPNRFCGHSGAVYDISMSTMGGGRCIASASADKTVRLWKNSPEGESHVMKVHTAAVRSVEFSRDGDLLLTASDDKTVKLWNVASQRFQGSFTGHTNWVYSAVFCKGPNMVVSAGEDKTVRVWDAERKALIVNFQDFEAPVYKVRCHPDGSCVAACGQDGRVKLWDLRSRRLVQHYEAHSGSAISIDFHPSGEYLSSASEQEPVKLWDLREGRLLYKLQSDGASPRDCSWAPSGRGLVSGTSDGLVLIWDCYGKSSLAQARTTGVETGHSTCPTHLEDAGPPTRRLPGRRTGVRSRAQSQPSGRRASQPGAMAGSQQALFYAPPVREQGVALAQTVPPARPAPQRASASPQVMEVPPAFSDAAQNLHEQVAPAQEAGIASAAASPPADVPSVPGPLAQTMRGMSDQLDIMARTVQLLERRLAMTEQQVTDLRKELAQTRSGQELAMPRSGDLSRDLK